MAHTIFFTVFFTLSLLKYSFIFSHVIIVIKFGHIPIVLIFLAFKASSHASLKLVAIFTLKNTISTFAR